MYKWQNKIRENLLLRRANMPHALLLKGRSGIGKHDFSVHLAQTLLCQSSPAAQQPCGACPSCTWFKEGAHPDFRLIQPEQEEAEEGAKKKTGKKTQISVEQIRDLTDYLSLSSHQSNGRRIILISPADTLNSASANALLKILEEPPAMTFFLLVSSQPHRLLPTILSRCQQVNMPVPDTGDATLWLAEQGVKQAPQWLQYTGGAPLAAASLAEMAEEHARLNQLLIDGRKLNAAACAPRLLNLGMEAAIEKLQKWVYDLQLLAQCGQNHFHTSQTNAMQALAKSVNLKQLLAFQRTLTEAKKTAAHPLSNELQLENILIQYTKIFA